MEFQIVYDQLTNGKLAPPIDKRLWEEASDRISVHAKGIRPEFINPRKARRLNDGSYMGGKHTPANYSERFQYLFDNYILNRHPNEQEEHYEFRKSVYPLLAQEVYLNGKGQVIGSIFQNSQYTISANDRNGEDLLKILDIDKRIKGDIFEHMLTDPFGVYAVIEKHWDEFGTDERAVPDIEIVESRHILHYEEKQSILFRASKDMQGRKLLYFLDKQYCIKLLSSTDGRKRNEYEIIAAYQHNLGVLPVSVNGIELFKAFVTWADLIGRNFSDDEIVAKNNNHPHIQMVESVCGECIGQCVVSYPCITCPDGVQEENCHTCKGRGTISRNPGEILVVKESDFRPGDMQGQGLQDRIKFINPDVAISQNSFERCWKIYEGGLKSLHLKYVDEAQSGTAKAIDREGLYLLISNCANQIFTITDSILTFAFGYWQLGIAENKPYTIELPTQYQIKTEADVQEELIALKDADLTVRRMKTNEYMQIVYTGNEIELKKWDVVRVWDALYCMNGEEITQAALGSNQTEAVIKHYNVESLLNRLILTKGAGWFNSVTLQVIETELNTMLEALLPVPRITA